MPIGVYERTEKHLKILEKARENIVRKPHSDETKKKIGDANRKPYPFNCDYCEKECVTTPSKYKRKKRHYCSQDCYSKDRKENWKSEEQHAWKGGVSNTEAHREWKAKNPERMAHLKARRYARKKGAEGSHTIEEWNKVKEEHDNKCAYCKESKKLTKDHIKPLSKGGSDYISNIQPLCRSCNSKKWAKENPELLEE